MSIHRYLTDLNALRRAAAEKVEENWRFRAWLKQSDLGIDGLDAIVHRLYDEASAAIDCTACGNCCRECRPLLGEDDIARLAAHHGLEPAAFSQKYVRPTEEEGGQEFAARPCSFLQGNRCAVYEHRPDDCRSYPHLHLDRTVSRLWGIMENCEVCPIVFNVVERLKREV